MPMFLLKIPTRHIMPKHKFKPPYNPAISEYPNGELLRDLQHLKNLDSRAQERQVRDLILPKLQSGHI